MEQDKDTPGAPLVVTATVVTDAQPVASTGGHFNQTPVVISNGNLPADMVHSYIGTQPGEGLLPPAHPNRPNSFNVALCDCSSCCACTPTCWMAWCCTCFPIAQLAQKLRNARVEFCMGYKEIIGWFCLLLLIQVILGMVVTFRMDIATLFLTVVLVQLRGTVRQIYNIRGDCCMDVLSSLFCAPCTVMQLIHQMWVQPDQTPGCDFSEHPAMVV